MSNALPRCAWLVLAFAASPVMAQHDGHAGHVMPSPPVTPIPVPTAADRAAAQPPAQGHPPHDAALHGFLLFDRLEAWHDDGVDGAGWDVHGWYGGDINRLWLRSEGEVVDGHSEAADIELLYGRAIAPWWDLVAGVRHDVGAHGRDWAAFGVQGLTPYKFEFAATVYVGESGHSEAALQIGYDTLLTNRLVLQSSLDATIAGRDDAARGVGSGLASAELGFRLRYEVSRRFAPYLGVVHERAFGTTADWRRADGEAADATRIVAGVRLWF